MNVYIWHQDKTSGNWEAVLERLKALETRVQQINEAKKRAPVSPETLATFQKLHNTLVAETRKVWRTSQQREALETLNNTLDNAFVEAMWMSLEQYPAIVHHPEIENLDTAGSKIFTCFTPDAPTDITARENLKAKLQQIFTIDAEILEKLNRGLAKRTAPLQHRHQIMQCLEAHFNLVSNNPDLDADVLRIFQYIYPGAPFEVGEVKLVKTASALLFCIPSAVKAAPTDVDNEPKNATPKHTKQTKTQLKEDKYERFLQEIWEVEPFAHFPVFGTFNAGRLELTFREQIAKDTELPVELITVTLTRMIGLLPLEELDKYLIHDTWGHQWQETLLDFEESYTELSGFKRPLSLTETASVFGEQTSFAEAFVKTSAGHVQLDAEKLQRFIDAELYERFIIAFTPILAEMLADVVEYKFLELYPEQAHLLPSSSLLKDFPSKLDLTLTDLRECFVQASEAFQTWVTSDAAKKRLDMEIREKLDIPNGDTLTPMLEEAAQLCKEQLNQFYQPEWSWEKTADNCLKLNPFSFTALNFLRIHIALLEAYDVLPQIGTQHGFKDALVLAMGTFFEIEPQRNIWHLDQFLTEGFLPRWEKLAEAGV